MKCPYTENRVTVIQTKIEYNEDGNQWCRSTKRFKHEEM